MKILIITSLDSSISSTRKKITFIIDGLLKTNEDIHIYDPQSVYDNYPTHVNYLQKNSVIAEREWDVILVQNNTNLSFIAKIIKKKPIIFLSNSQEITEQPIDFPNLYKVILTDNTLPIKIGLPMAMVSKIDINPIDYWNLKINKKVKHERKKVLYVANDESFGLTVTRKMIKVFNINPDIDFTIATDFNTIPVLRSLINGNLKLTKKTNSLKTLFQNHDLVITSKDTAISAVLSNKLTIVAGQNGLGGHINTNSLRGFIRTGFNGRIGGTPDEEIPEYLLDFEITSTLDTIKEKTTAPDNVVKSSELSELKNIINKDWLSKLQAEIEQSVMIYRKLSQKTQHYQLRPQIADNISLRNVERGTKGEHVILINNFTGKIMGVLGSHEITILHLCNGLLNIKEIIEINTIYTKKDIIDFILMLWKTRILVFHNIQNRVEHELSHSA